MDAGKRNSIAWRLSVWYAGSAFILLAVGTGFLYFVLASSFERENTDYLTEKTRTLETLLREHPANKQPFSGRSKENLLHTRPSAFCRGFWDPMVKSASRPPEWHSIFHQTRFLWP